MCDHNSINDNEPKQLIEKYPTIRSITNDIYLTLSIQKHFELFKYGCEQFIRDKYNPLDDNDLIIFLHHFRREFSLVGIVYLDPLGLRTQWDEFWSGPVFEWVLTRASVRIIDLFIDTFQIISTKVSESLMLPESTLEHILTRYFCDDSVDTTFTSQSSSESKSD
jgi:hypothetical protein